MPVYGSGGVNDASMHEAQGRLYSPGPAVLSNDDDRRIKAATAAGMAGGKICPHCRGTGSDRFGVCLMCWGHGWIPPEGQRHSRPYSTILQGNAPSGLRGES